MAKYEVIEDDVEDRKNCGLTFQTTEICLDMADQDSSIEDDDRLSEEEGERDSSSDDQKDSLADVIASHYLDELDYEELIQSDTPIDPPSFLSDEGVMRKKEEEEEEEGELLSDEEEIKSELCLNI